MPCNWLSYFINLEKTKVIIPFILLISCLCHYLSYYLEMSLSPSGKLLHTCHLSAKNSKLNCSAPKDQAEENLSFADKAQHHLSGATMPDRCPVGSYGFLVLDTVVPHTHTWTLGDITFNSTTCSAISLA